MHFWSHVRRIVAVVLLGAMSIPAGTLAARAEEPPIYLDWPTLLPSLTDTYNPTSANECVAGRPHCIDATIKEMRRRFQVLGSSCDHNAVFSLAYLRTTQTYKWARDQDGYFADTPWVNHADAVFAKYYFNAYDRWAAGRRDEVPEAWSIAFDAAAAQRVTGSGDLLLGMSAHVNRDLPLVLAAIGISTPDGQPRKPDHDKVDEFLNTVVQPLLTELAARLDSDVVHLVTPYGVGYTGLFQTLQAWRERAWRNAELLTNAPTAQVRAVVAQEIEVAAATEASSLALANTYVPPLTTSGPRNTFCARHNADPPPMSYAFGPASAY